MYHLLVLPILFIDWILLLVAKYHGFNIMESLKLVLKSKNLDEKYQDLYKKVCYYADYLREPGAKTEADANMTSQ